MDEWAMPVDSGACEETAELSVCKNTMYFPVT